MGKRWIVTIPYDANTNQRIAARVWRKSGTGQAFTNISSTKKSWLEVSGPTTIHVDSPGFVSAQQAFPDSNATQTWDAYLNPEVEVDLIPVVPDTGDTTGVLGVFLLPLSMMPDDISQKMNTIIQNYGQDAGIGLIFDAIESMYDEFPGQVPTLVVAPSPYWINAFRTSLESIITPPSTGTGDTVAVDTPTPAEDTSVDTTPPVDTPPADIPTTTPTDTSADREPQTSPPIEQKPIGGDSIYEEPFIEPVEIVAEPPDTVHPDKEQPQEIIAPSPPPAPAPEPKTMAPPMPPKWYQNKGIIISAAGGLILAGALIYLYIKKRK